MLVLKQLFTFLKVCCSISKVEFPKAWICSITKLHSNLYRNCANSFIALGPAFNNSGSNSAKIMKLHKLEGKAADIIFVNCVCPWQAFPA
jgi:hypothetical protein